MKNRYNLIAASTALMVVTAIGNIGIAGASQNPCSSIVNDSGSEITCDPFDLEISSGNLTLSIPEVGSSAGVADVSADSGLGSDSLYISNNAGIVTVNDLTSAGVVSGGLSACSDAFYVLGGYKESNNHAWYFNNSGSGSWLGTGSGLSSDLAAANIMTNATNNCSIVANPTNQSTYVGLTSRTPDVQSNGQCPTLPQDTVNVHGWASGLPGGTLARTCWWGVPKPGIDELSTADVVFNSTKKWFSTIPSGCSGAYDMVGVAAHEWGHVFGLSHADHPSTHANLTMSSIAGSCTVAQRSLGKGDVLGLLALYP